jgi:hypothetical protein
MSLMTGPHRARLASRPMLESQRRVLVRLQRLLAPEGMRPTPKKDLRPVHRSGTQERERA